MADATVTTTKQLNQDDLVRLVGAPVTLVSGSWTSTSAKTISAPVSQTALTTAINEYHYLPGEYTPQNAPDELTPLIDRAPAVLAGTDSFHVGGLTIVPPAVTSAAPVAVTSTQEMTANANAAGVGYVQADQATIVALLNDLKAKYNAAQADIVALRATLLATQVDAAATIAALGAAVATDSLDAQTILAWLLVAFHGAKVSPPGTPGAQEPNPAGYSY